MTGWLVTVFAVTYAITAPFFGRASDKNGRNFYYIRVIVIFSSALTAFSSSFTWLIISRILVGWSVAASTPLIYTIIGVIAPSNREVLGIILLFQDI
ncbi:MULTISPECIES: MFS transporter [Cytobacillus]|uniref:MFS transporter n=1 Tax=Cytobacillus TaxID=2675230 RepID=UPI001FBB30E5|nr:MULTISPECIES: MFS transporter [Cytobacillus]